MNKYIVIFSIIFILAACITTDKNKSNDPTKFVLKEDIDKQKLREYLNNLFNYIEEKISNGDFNGWYNSISQKYKDFINSPKNLRTISENSDFLVTKRIKLRTPEDYFKNVVILSREGKILEFIDCDLINKNHVKIYCLFDKTDKFVYDFIFEEGSWKIDR